MKNKSKPTIKERCPDERLINDAGINMSKQTLNLLRRIYILQEDLNRYAFFESSHNMQTVKMTFIKLLRDNRYTRSFEL